MKRILHGLLLFFFLTISAFCIAENPIRTIEFYGMLSNSSDIEMLKLAQDLIYSYIEEMPNTVLIDKRKTMFSDDVIAEKSDNYIFFITLYEKEQKWEFSLNLIDAASGKIKEQTKIYDNYYRILLEIRTLLQTLFTSTEFFQRDIRHSDVIPEVSNDESVKIAQYAAIPITSTEILAGNWKNNEYIEKAVILKGGRGFIIFTNGMSMNIVITISGGSMTVTQVGPSNYKYFPELAESEAREVAKRAPAISWHMELASDITVLFGEKTTYVPEYEDGVAVGVKEVSYESVWTR